jgi:hypothetical protein
MVHAAQHFFCKKMIISLHNDMGCGKFIGDVTDTRNYIVKTSRNSLTYSYKQYIRTNNIGKDVGIYNGNGVLLGIKFGDSDFMYYGDTDYYHRLIGVKCEGQYYIDREYIDVGIAMNYVTFMDEVSNVQCMYVASGTIDNIEKVHCVVLMVNSAKLFNGVRYNNNDYFYSEFTGNEIPNSVDIRRTHYPIGIMHNGEHYIYWRYFGGDKTSVNYTIVPEDDGIEYIYTTDEDMCEMYFARYLDNCDVNALINTISYCGLDKLERSSVMRDPEKLQKMLTLVGDSEVIASLIVVMFRIDDPFIYETIYNHVMSNFGGDKKIKCYLAQCKINILRHIESTLTEEELLLILRYTIDEEEKTLIDNRLKLIAKL